MYIYICIYKNIYWVWFWEIKMILPIYVISLYCNIKHMFETWKYLYKSGSPDDKCKKCRSSSPIWVATLNRNYHHHQQMHRFSPTPTSRSKGQKSRGGGILWRPPSRTACCNSFFRCMPSVIESGLHVSQTGDITLLSSEQHTDT